jgi:hypothetical protein
VAGSAARRETAALMARGSSSDWFN